MAQDKPQGTAKALLIVLAAFANDRGQVTRSQQEMAGACGVTRRCIHNALKALEREALIVRTPRYWEDGGRATDVVQLNWLGGMRHEH